MLLGGCVTAVAPPATPIAVVGPADPQATPETRALFVNLRTLARSHVLFGHQDDLAYGHDWIGEAGRSDVKETSGSYPAMYGWDISRIEHDSAVNIDGVPFDGIRRWVAEGYGRGAAITLSWHMDNMTTGGNAWDTTSSVHDMLPGGRLNGRYKLWLDRFAAFVSSLRARGRDGGETLVPVIFRPFHENTGSWFWWGATHTSPAEYRQLWSFTERYLQNEKGVHNLLFAYSPNAGGASGVEHYMEFYPGDSLVDVLGYDEYYRPPSSGEPDPVAAMSAHLRWLVTTAEAHRKIPALTETGYERIPDSTWWTSSLLRAIKGDSVSRRIAYVLTWRNGNRAALGREHFYVPYKGQSSAADFVRFRNDPLMMFESDLPPLYTLPR
jgi:mannan endo-1,4-beta-mannosidase